MKIIDTILNTLKSKPHPQINKQEQETDIEEKTQNWLIRIEAVNINKIIEDTQQLSVRRGASIAINNLFKEFEPENINSPWEKLRSGGSVGLFTLEATENIKNAIIEDIYRHINHDPDIKFSASLGFTVSATPYEKDNTESEIKAQKQSVAESHFQQLKMPSFNFSDLFEEEAKSACELDGKYPKIEELDNTDKTKVSKFSKDRFAYGKAQKKDFINDITGRDTDDYVKSFEGLTQIKQELIEARSTPKAIKKISGKMAVLYFDGNNFGNKQVNLDFEQLKAFEEKLQTARKTFIQELVTAFGSVDNLKDKDGKIRLELLMWGGDELLLVVPAWAGFYTLNLFYQTMNQQLLLDDDPDTKLTHAGGLVFCSHKTPIQRVTNLVKELAEYAKSISREENLYYSMLLESEDYPIQSVSQHWQQHYQKLGKALLPLIPYETMPDFKKYRYTSVSKSALYKYIGQFFRDCANTSCNGTKIINHIKDIEEKGNLKQQQVENWFPLHKVIEDQLDVKTLSEYERQQITDREHETKQLQPWVYLIEYGDYLINPISKTNANGEGES